MPMTDGPSAGAARAARAILGMPGSGQYAPTQGSIDKAAQIIMCETGVKELREALEMLVADNQRRAMHEGVTVNWAAIHLAQAAILKAKG